MLKWSPWIAEEWVMVQEFGLSEEVALQILPASPRRKVVTGLAGEYAIERIVSARSRLDFEFYLVVD